MSSANVLPSAPAYGDREETQLYPSLPTNAENFRLTEISKIEKEISAEAEHYRLVLKKYKKVRKVIHYSVVCLGAVTAALSSGAVATSLTGVGIVIGAPVAAVAGLALLINMSQSPDVAVATVLSILVIANIIGNSAVCLIIMKNRDMRIPINYLLVNLAVADIVFATFLAPKFILSHTFTHPNGMTGKVLCRLLTGGTLGWVGGVSSAFTLVAIAIERYYAVMHPLGNKGKLTKRKLKVIIPGSWIFSLVVTFPGFLITNFDKEIDGCGESFPEEWMAKAYSLTWLLSTTALPLALMVGLYSTVAYALWFKRNEDSQLTHQQKSVIKVRKRVTLMVVTVSAIFGISWGTSSVSYVLKHFSSHNIGNVAITNTMAMFNSAVNPFVYALLNQQFREKVKGMMGCSTFLTRKIHPTRKSENYDLTNSINPSTIED
ncbi:hypothetical protein ACROYT_G038925 [Oculina patagonica]